jgi:hypothetical protein
MQERDIGGDVLIVDNAHPAYRDALLYQSDRGTPPDVATPKGSSYCFNFLTQRGDGGAPRGVRMSASGRFCCRNP